MGPKNTKCCFCKRNFPTKCRPASNSTLNTHLQRFHCQSIDVYDMDTGDKIGTCTRPKPLADLSCFIAGCDAHARSAAVLKMHILKLHTDGANICMVYDPFPTLPEPTKKAKPGVNSAKQVRKAVAVLPVDGPVAKNKRAKRSSAPAPTGIERLQALYSAKPTELEEEWTDDGGEDEKSRSDDDDEHAEVNLNEPVYRNSTRARSLTDVQHPTKRKSSGDHASVALAEDLSGVLASKLDDIHSAFDRLAAATEQRNTLLIRLLSVLAKDGMGNNLGS